MTGDLRLAAAPRLNVPTLYREHVLLLAVSLAVTAIGSKPVEHRTDLGDAGEGNVNEPAADS